MVRSDVGVNRQWAGTMALGRVHFFVLIGGNSPLNGAHLRAELR